MRTTPILGTRPAIIRLSRVIAALDRYTISDVNLPYSQISREYLLREGLPPDRVIVTGSVRIVSGAPVLFRPVRPGITGWAQVNQEIFAPNWIAPLGPAA